MRLLSWVLAAALSVGVAFGQGAVVAPPAGPFTATGGTALRTPADRATDTIQAVDYGSCIWDSAHDVGACINAAIAKAVALGGRTVNIPAGTFGLSTPIVQNTSGVHLQGAGIGIARDTVVPGAFVAATRLVWIGSAGAGPALDVEPANGATQFLYSADVTGFAVDCQDLLDTCAQIKQVSASVLRFGQSEARKTGVLLATNNIDGSGVQQNDVWIWARNISASFSASSIVLDSGAGASYNNSYNPAFHLLSAAYAGGDGIVIGNADTNIFELLAAYHYGSATTGSPIVCANASYVPPSGVTVHGQCYDNLFMLLGAPTQFGGYTQGSVLTQSGANTGTATLNAVTIPTTAPTSGGNSVLTFSSTTGIGAGEGINCGGAASGVYPNTQVQSVTPTTVTMRNPAVIGGGISGVASGLSCTFSYAETSAAAPGTYTITATSGSTFSVTAPAGGHTQALVTYSAGLLPANDFTLPLTGTPVIGDTWTLLVPTPSAQNQVIKVDKANAISDPHFEPGASGHSPIGNNAIPNLYGPGGLAIAADSGNFLNVPVTASGVGAVGIGGISNNASGPDSIVIGGIGNNATAFYATTIGGQNNTSSGVGSLATGQNNTASGTDGQAAGSQAADRGRYATTCWASGSFATNGNPQVCRSVLRATGSSTTAIRLTADQLAAGSANCINIPNNTIYSLLITTTALDHTTVANNEIWPAWTGKITRGANAAATAVKMSTTPTPLTDGTVTGSAIAATADTTNGCVNISFTPPTGNTDTWNVSAGVETVEVQ